jgi:hypothetical protein
MNISNFYFSTMPFSPLTACRSSSKNTEKMNLQPILIKNSPWAHTKSEFDVFGKEQK